MADNKSENTRLAIEIMTAWAGDPDGLSDFITERLRSVVEQREDRDRFQGALHLIFGFINLTGRLLIQREHEMGVADIETLQALALELAGE